MLLTQNSIKIADSYENIIFYGTSENSFYYAGFNETETKKLLEDNNLKEARILFKKKILNKLHINIDISQIDLFFGESSSD